jgi:hypothetical protein
MPRRNDHRPAFRTIIAPRAVLAIAVAALMAGCASHSDTELFKKVMSQQTAAEKKCRLALWVDHKTGKITRVQLIESSGEPLFDRLAQSQLIGVKIDPPPPASTPMPIFVNISDQQKGESANSLPSSTQSRPL